MRPDLIVCVSDLHSGSRDGLCPAEGISLEGDALYIPGPAGQEAWRFWLDLAKTVEGKLEETGAELTLLLNGDLTDGKRFADQALIDIDLSTQIEIAVQCFEPLLALRPKHVFVTRGTPVHAGVFASLENAVAKRIGANADPTRKGRRTYTRHSWLLNAHDRRILALHHPPSSGRLVRTRQSQMSLAANEVAQRFWERRGPDGKPLTPPDVVVFSHKHEPDESGPVLPHRTGTRAVILGPWQRPTEYARKVAPAATVIGYEYHAALMTIYPERWRSIVIDHLVWPQKAAMDAVQI